MFLERLGALKVKTHISTFSDPYLNRKRFQFVFYLTSFEKISFAHFGQIIRHFRFQKGQIIMNCQP